VPFFPYEVPGNTFYRAMRARERIVKRIRPVIEEGASDSELLARAHKIVSGDGTEEIEDLVIGQLFAAHDTTSSMLTEVAHRMCQHPEVMAKIRAEVAGLTEKDLEDYKVVSNQPYTNCFVREVLRINPVVGLGKRKLLKGVEYKGYTLPAGWCVVYSPAAMQFNPAVWPNPERFDPERHANCELRNLPVFGGGSRMCLGQNLALLEVRLFAIMLARSARIAITGDCRRVHFPICYTDFAFTFALDH